MATATATATMTMTMKTLSTPPQRSIYLQHIPIWRLPQCVLINNGTDDTKASSTTMINRCHRPFSSRSYSLGHLRPRLKPLSAVGSGLEASISDPKSNYIKVKNPVIVVESQDSDQMQVRVDVSGVDTGIVFDKVLINLTRTAPPVPGFRLQKGGKMSKVPKEFLLQMLGEERVMNFVVQEIVSSVLADFVKKENLAVKDNKINTLQTAEELRSLFSPGNEFGFNATLELANSASGTAN